MAGSHGGSADSSAALYRVGDWLIDNRGWVSLVTIAFTAFMAYEASKLEMFTSFNELLPYRHPFIAVHDKWSKQFGGANNLTIMFEVKHGTIFTQEVLRKIYTATQFVDVFPDVNHDQIDSIAHRTTRYLRAEPNGAITVAPVMRHPPASDMDVQQVEALAHISENIHGVLVSLDDKAALLRVNFHEGRVDYRKIFYEVNEKIIDRLQDDNLKIWVAGEPRLYGWIYRYSNDVFWILVVTYSIEWVLRWLYFHDWRGALRPTITGALAAVWGLGFIRLIGFALDPLMLVVPFLITARAVSHAIQMHDRYYEEYMKNDWHKRKAIVAAFAELFVPTFSGIVTDALGVLVILLVPVVMLQKLAITASWWIFAITVSEVLLNPIVYYYLRAPEPEMVILREEGWFRRAMDRVTDLTLSHAGRAVTVAFWAAVAIGSVFFLKGLTIGDPTAASPLLWQDSAYNQSHTRIQRFFGGVEPLIVVVEGKQRKAIQQPESLEAIESFQRYVDSDPDVGYSWSMADVLKSITQVFYDTDPRWGVISEEPAPIANLLFYYFGGATPSELAKSMDPSYTYSHVTFFCRNHQGDTVARIIQRCRDYIAKFPSRHRRLPPRRGDDRCDGSSQRGDREERHPHERPRDRDDLLDPALHLPLVRRRPLHAAAAVRLERVRQRVHEYAQHRREPAHAAGRHGGHRVRHRLRPVHRQPNHRGDSLCGDLYEAVKTALCTTGKGVTFTAVTMVMSTMFWTTSNIRFDAEMGGLLAIWMAISFVASQTLMPVLILIFKPRFIMREVSQQTVRADAARA